MKKIGSVILFVIGALFLLYGFIVAHMDGFIRSLVPATAMFWAIVLCLFNTLIPQIKKKTWMQIVTVVVFVLLIWNSVTVLSGLSRIPTYMIGASQAKVEYVLLYCPDIFSLLGALMLVIGGRLMGAVKYKDIEEACIDE